MNFHLKESEIDAALRNHKMNISNSSNEDLKKNYHQKGNLNVKTMEIESSVVATPRCDMNASRDQIRDYNQQLRSGGRSTNSFEINY